MNGPLRESEILFIRMIRSFDFLRSLGYSGESFSVWGPESPSILFVKNSPVRKIGIYIGSRGILEVDIERPPRFIAINKRIHFTVQEVYRYWPASTADRSPETPEELAEFMQKNLMPVLKGEIWIDELLRRIR
jgi:hypothetical protein